jgi:hypothetical protein
VLEDAAYWMRFASSAYGFAFCKAPPTSAPGLRRLRVARSSLAASHGLSVHPHAAQALGLLPELSLPMAKGGASAAEQAGKTAAESGAGITSTLTSIISTLYQHYQYPYCDYQYP